MKTLLIFAISVLLLTSCGSLNTYKFDYSVRVVYFNGDVDSLSGQYSFKSLSKDKEIDFSINSNGCLGLYDGFFILDRLACGVRTFTVLKQNKQMTEDK